MRTFFVKLLIVTILTILVLGQPQKIFADPYPPYWQNGSGSAVHYQPVAWPTEPANPQDCGLTCGQWQPYTRYASSINDQRTQDPSNGGTAPQNYVNVASSCIDKTSPSVYYYLDPVNNVVMFRWRVEQIANNYATGPSAGNYSSTSPWNASLWTVFFDIDGNGYRDLAAHLNGSSGDPSTAVDRIVGIWGDIPNNQSLDYPTNPNIHLLGHIPAAFVDQPTGRILNFQSSLQPTPNWPNGAAETVWDYGTSRSRQVTATQCNEYFVDYQIPLAMVDASSLGGPKLDSNTPISMLFCTANSLNNPFQKDCVFEGAWTADPYRAAPFGDFFTLNSGALYQPIVDAITANGCGPTNLTASIKDAIDIVNGVATTSVTAVTFHYYLDVNNDGLANDGSNWTLATSATNTGLNQWTAAWNATPLLQGQYLIGVEAIDGASKNLDGKANHTYSYLTQAEVDALKLSPGEPGNEHWYPNPAVTGAVSTTVNVNSCGALPPYVEKTASASQVSVGGNVQFTITVHNTLNTALTVSTLADLLPAGFHYMSTDGGTLNPTTAPIANATDTVNWTFSPAATLAANSTGTLIFTVQAATVVGTYSNVAQANTSYGLLTGPPIPIGVGEPRLTIAKAASAVSFVPGETITYTITYGNDSPISVVDAVITDNVPVGLSNITALDGGAYDSGADTITWNVGDIATGEGPFTVRFTATLADPYPDAATIPLVNSVTIDSVQTAPASAQVGVFVDVPRANLTLQKRANLLQVAPAGQVVFTLAYQNTGNADASAVVIADVIPSGFTFVAASGNGANSSGTVTWNIGTVAAGGSGTVTLTLQANNPYTGSNPATNTATIDAAQTDPVLSSTIVGVSQSSQLCTTYYFHNETTNVGFDGTHTIANTTAPLVADTAAGTLVTANADFIEAVRFYQDPAFGYDVAFSGQLTTTFYVDRDPGPGITVRAFVYDYNATSGVATQLGTSDTIFQGSKTGALSFTVNLNGTLQNGHRLLWVFQVKSNQNNQTAPILFQYDGQVPNSVSDTTSPIATTFANSSAYFCAVAPANLLMEKQVSTATAQPGATLHYTITFANIGQSATTGTRITDTLPSGVTFVNATLHGAAIVPTSTNGQQYVFNVNSSGQSSGVIAGSNGGTLVINATVNQPLPLTTTTITNTATLDSNETSPTTDTVTTKIERSSLTISKAVNATLLIPGDIVTYTLTVLNSGKATATNVIVNDTLPTQAYFAYVADSTVHDGVPVAPDPVSAGVLQLNLGSLPVGVSTTIALRMRVANIGAPSGVVSLANQATVSDSQSSEIQSSNIVTVSISTNPNLRLTKSAGPPRTLAPGDLVTYTIEVSNIGAGDALAVTVQDSMPANTTYERGTLVYENVPQTDGLDADNGTFDPAANRVAFAVGTLPGGAIRTLHFTVRVNTPLPNGLTVLHNLASVSANNSAAKEATADGQAIAAPILHLEKVGPTSVPYPAAKLTIAATNTTLLTVDSSAQLVLGQYLLIGAEVRQISTIDNNLVTLDTPITAPANAELIGEIVYTLNYQNSGNAIATGVSLTDTLPNATTFITATAGGLFEKGAVIWDLGTVLVGESGQVRLRIFPDEPGEFINQADIDSNETAPVSDSLTTVVGGLRLRKYTTTPVVQQTLTGVNQIYILEIDNNGEATANNVIISDTLPAGFTYQSTNSITGGTRSIATPDPVAGTNQPVWGTFSIPGFSTLSITFVVKISETAGRATYQNDVAATATNMRISAFDPLLALTEDVTVQVPVIILTKNVTPSSVMAGDSVVYTIAARNIGDAVATDVQITDMLPGGFTYTSDVAISEDQATRTDVSVPNIGSTTPTWGMWDIAPSGQITIVFRVNAGLIPGVFTNSVSATASNTLIPPLTGVAAVTMTAPSVTDLSLDKSSTPNPHVPGQPLTYTIAVTNAGPSTLTTIELPDALPAAVLNPQYNTNGNGSYDINTGAWTGLDLAEGETVRLTIMGTVDPNFSGLLSNRAVVTATGATDPNLSNNWDDDQNFSQNSFRYALQQRLITPSPVRPGEGISFAIRITNTGAFPITELPLHEVYDVAYLQFVTATPQSVDNNNDGELDWGDLTASFGQGLAPGAVFEVVVHFIAVQDTALLLNALTISTATAHDVIGDPDGGGPLPAHSVPNAPPSSADVAILTENQQGRLNGVVFYDNNQDGVHTQDENGVVESIVELRQSTGELMSRQTTTNVGGYLFVNLLPGSYQLHAILAQGATSTTPETVFVNVVLGASLQVDFGVNFTPS